MPAFLKKSVVERDSTLEEKSPPMAKSPKTAAIMAITITAVFADFFIKPPEPFALPRRFFRM